MLVHKGNFRGHAPSYGSATGFGEHAQGPGNPQEAKGNRRFVEACPCRSARNDAGTSGMVCLVADTVAPHLFASRSLPRQSGRS